MMKNFVLDMEEQQEEGSDRRTHTLINEIRQIAYDAEDVIESHIIERFEASSSDSKTTSTLKRALYFITRLPTLHQVGSEIEAIKARIAETTKNWKKYQVDDREKAKRVRRKTPMTFPHTIEEHVVGLKEDINTLVEVLTVDETQVKLVSIVGMGGSGKTTLARKLFNHESVKIHFDCMAWVAISEQWDTKQILLEILRISTRKPMKKDEAHSERVIVEKLSRYLEGKRYLIVLDDVWTKQALDEILPALLPSRNDGRKIIITTRKREVVDFPDLKRHVHEPRRLTDDESWELFIKIVCIQNFVNISFFEALGREMLKKCGGLPLAVIALAGILANKKTLEEWEKVKKAVSSRIMEEGRGTHLYGPVKEMLSLSYNDMPNEFKPCFLYLATFPEDYEIPVGRLCRMWIAEGLIPSYQLHVGETLEDVAREYLEELIGRCVVQSVRRNDQGEVKTIRIHDLVRDMCIKKAKEQDFLAILPSNSSNSNERAESLRRVVIHSEDIYIPLPTTSHHLRSLIVWIARLEIEPISYPLRGFRLLRVLLLSNVKQLPDEIGRLIHLRYLGFIGFFDGDLPSSIGNLRSLLTLEYMVSNYDEAIGIPDVLWKLSSLQHLYLPKHVGKYCGLKLDTLKNLRILKGMRGGSWMVEELPNLSPAVQKLEIVDIESEEQLEAAFRCPSIREDHLHSLNLRWMTLMEDDVMLKNQLGPIVHCQNLRKLVLWGRIQEKDGINIQFPTSLTKIVLADSNLEAEATVAGLGKLPNLTSLCLISGSYMGTKWSCTATDFPQLKQLMLADLDELEEWSIEGGAMPVLIELRFQSCGKLRRVQGLEFITTLQELEFRYPNDELKERIREGGEDAHLFQHVPRVEINP